jgi:MFS family permease
MSSGLGAFRSLLAYPGGSVQSVFGLIGRAPGAMLSVGFVASASAAGGEAGYALGGLAAGAYSLASAVAGPTLGRMADQRGQRRVGVSFALVSAAAAMAAVLSLLAMGVSWLLVPFAAVAGATQPNVGAFARVRWAAILRDRDRAASAQALESIIDELTFLIGPPITALLAGVWFDGLPIAIAAAFLLVGIVGVTSRIALPAPLPHPVQAGASRWRTEFPAGRGLLAAVLLMGGVLGSIQVLQLAYCRAIGMDEGAALVFFVNSGLSLVGALVVGAIAWRTPVRRRFTIALVIYAVAVVPSALVSGYLPFVLASALAGVAIAPTFVQANAVIAEETPARIRTAAFALVASAAGLGIASGAALAGWIVSQVGGDQGRLVLVPLAIGTGIVSIVADLTHRSHAVDAADADMPLSPELEAPMVPAPAPPPFPPGAHAHDHAHEAGHAQELARHGSGGPAQARPSGATPDAEG